MKVSQLFDKIGISKITSVCIGALWCILISQEIFTKEIWRSRGTGVVAFVQYVLQKVDFPATEIIRVENLTHVREDVTATKVWTDSQEEEDLWKSHWKSVWANPVIAGIGNVASSIGA